ncbi:NADH dehydrogenase subunit 2 (mitochondrion) [Parastagonospora nodorum SN15]|uniref:NADH-ubiquinone oxidoreductase chain 2 n=1 Tax=Phaeosphaeria nodorum (strain SN15 / ATCC MYA-4574 / FGSC 10173) TaxID=321614 RepID=A7UG16_PHANO|nr:NADH dehydrogenase subunit 2 [Parastagonospora nodorum SN15]ABU49450.1 NADH dehydrogenase subunit 2 [Parastagonospora nodorum SN15]
MLLNSLILLLLSNAITSRRDKSILYSRVSISILLISALISYDNLSILFLAKGIGIFGGLFHVTATTNTFHIFIFLMTSVILLLTSFYPRKVWFKPNSTPNRILFTKLIYYGTLITNKMGEQFKIIEYSLIILFIVTGSVFLISTSDLVSIFLSIELQSYGLYLLSTIYRDSEPATSGGLMYFLLGGLSSCFILLSTALLYANSGTTNLDSLYIITSISNERYENLTGLLYWYKPYYIHISLLFMGVGFLFKVSAAPFHFWSPDVYDAIPTVVTTFVAIIAKISIFIFLLELVHYTGKSMMDMEFSWTQSLLFSSLLSLIIGTVVGLTQSRIKRLFAFSTISHVGFILLGLSIHTVESTQAFMFYLIQYSISNLNAFILIITVGYSLYCYVYNANFLEKKEISDEKDNLQDMNNSPIQLIDQLKGYYYINPFVSLSLGITLFSFAGIPPLIGFFGKQMILSAAIDNGYLFMSLVAILTSVISAVYYLTIIKQIFFDKNDYSLNDQLETLDAEGVVAKENSIVEKVGIKIENVVISSSLSLPISVITLIITLFIFIPKEIFSLANILALVLFNL